MRKIKLFLLVTVAALCSSCAGWPWNKNLPIPPEGMDSVKLYAIIVGQDAFDRIAGENVTVEQAADIWHRVPSTTIYFKEVRYKREKTDPLPPPDATAICPETAKYAVFVSGLKMRRFDAHGIIVLCGEGKIYYGKALIAVSPAGMSINGKAVDIPDLTVHTREVLDAQKDQYEKVPNVADVTVSSDGHWWEGVQSVSP